MVNAVQIQQAINYGYQQAANILGTICSWYRPVDFQNATTTEALQGTITVRFDPKPNFEASQAAVFGKPLWYGMFDRTNTLVGDYLMQQASTDGTANGGTWFIAAQQSLIPTLCVFCNDTVSFYRPTSNTPGAAYYGGDVSGTGTPLMVNFPCSLVKGPKGQESIGNLPGDTKAPFYEVLVPAYAELMTDDVMTDSNNSRYIVSSVERTDLGYRLTVQYANT